MPVKFLYTLIGVQSDTSLDASTSVRIPNAEIQSEFHGWIQKDFQSRMTPELSETSIGQFKLMVNGHFAEFAVLWEFLFQRGSTMHFWGLRVSISRIRLHILLECCSRPKGQTEVDHQDGGRCWAGPSVYFV